MSNAPDSKSAGSDPASPRPAMPAGLREDALQALSQGEFDLLDKALRQGKTSILELVEDLRIYQAELEIQNEELRHSRLETERALSRFTRLFAMLPVAALVVDRQGLVVETNRIARELFLFADKQSGYQFFYRLIQADDHEAVQRLLDEALVHGESAVHDIRFRRGNADIFRGDLSVARLPGETGEDDQVICTVLDRTAEIEQRAALDRAWREQEDALIHARKEMAERLRVEEELRQSRDRLVAANAGLSDAMRVQNEFLANVSHELRTPLTAIIGLSTVLVDDACEALSKNHQQAVRTIAASGQQLLRIINDILDIAKIEAGTLYLNWAACDVEDICRSCLRNVEPGAAARNQQVAFSDSIPGAQVRADARRFKQMLHNLLDNAVKFTPAGGRIGLDVSGDAAAEWVRLSVWDTGIGISQENRSRLFRSFVQLDGSRTRSYGGTGLGLALVRRLAELHGGSVEVESAAGQGSRFTITLPWHPAGAPVD